jgi:hypothetical protein
MCDIVTYVDCERSHSQPSAVGLWTLDYGFLTPLDFGLQGFDPRGLWTSEF